MYTPSVRIFTYRIKKTKKRSKNLGLKLFLTQKPNSNMIILRSITKS